MTSRHVNNLFIFKFRFAEHKTDFPEIPTERPILISCRQPGCRCVSFEYVANASGTSDPNCRCKHSLDNHATKPPYKCQKSIPKNYSLRKDESLVLFRL
jgi:hypothetical protein